VAELAAATAAVSLVAVLPLMRPPGPSSPTASAATESALAITEAALSPDHPDTALRLDNLAYTLDALGRHSDAAAVRERLPAGAPAADYRSSGPSGP
jgi:hypothetical protein